MAAMKASQLISTSMNVSITQTRAICEAVDWRSRVHVVNSVHPVTGEYNP